LVVVLEDKHYPQHHITVASTHLIGDPNQIVTRLEEQQTLLTTIHRSMNESRAVQKSCIICGDFNSNEVSSNYEFMTHQQLPNSFVDAETGKQVNNHVPFQHPVRGLRSAMTTSFSREPPCTFITDTLYKTVDFIFYTGSLNVTAGYWYDAWNLNTRQPGLPNEAEPSDHIAIVAEFN
jgi:mRNA deadenylase 3'-5' endonuclease subunit Ccr4